MVIGKTAVSKKSQLPIVFVELDMNGIEKFTEQLVKNLEQKKSSVMCFSKSGKLWMMDDEMASKPKE
jgi:hypothetical protein